MGKMNRSGVYYLINTVTPINHVSKAEFDAFGSVIVVGPASGNGDPGAVCPGLGA